MVQLTSNEAATRLSQSKQWTAALARRGAVDGIQLADGRWLIDSNSVNRHDRTRAGAGRPWSARASWCALAELVGHRLPGIDSRLRFRVRQRLRTSTPEQLSRKVAHRARWERFVTSDRHALEAALTITGSNAARCLAPELMSLARGLQGYATDPTRIQTMLRSARLLPDESGDVWIAAPCADWKFEDITPASVIAADLAISADPRERAAGLRVLAELQDRWLDAHDA